MSPGNVLVVGGRSDIGLAIAHRFAMSGWDIQLTARDPELLESDVSDLSIRYGVNVLIYPCDVMDRNCAKALIGALSSTPDVVVIAVGLLGNQKKAQDDLDHAYSIIQTNYIGPASILEQFATIFERRGHGSLVAISSVAGDRGRASNYYYGSAKAGLSALLSGLRNRLAKHGVQVLTVKPGFVTTKMVEGIELPQNLTTTPSIVAKDVWVAIAKKRDVVYSLGRWRVIMKMIQIIPESIFKRLNL